MNTNQKTMKIVGLGLLTAVVVVLQAMAVGIRFGVFNITLVLVPIIVGAALYGWIAGAWLGLVFGIVVLFTDAGVFLAISVPGTVAVCLLKGILAGAAAGAMYRYVVKKKPDAAGKLLAVILAGCVAPIVNTGVFLIGCRIFFYDTIAGWAGGAGFDSVGAYMIFGLVGINFVVELLINLVLSTAIVQLIGIANKAQPAEGIRKEAK